jgi:hypothetical protein
MAQHSLRLPSEQMTSSNIRPRVEAKSGRSSRHEELNILRVES